MYQLILDDGKGTWIGNFTLKNCPRKGEFIRIDGCKYKILQITHQISPKLTEIMVEKVKKQ